MRVCTDIIFPPEPKAIGLDSDPFDLPMNQWSVDFTSWPEIVFPDIYIYLISTLQSIWHLEVLLSKIIMTDEQRFYDFWITTINVADMVRPFWWRLSSHLATC